MCVTFTGNVSKYHAEYNIMLITCHITEFCLRTARYVIIVKVHHNYSTILGLEQRLVEKEQSVND